MQECVSDENGEEYKKKKRYYVFAVFVPPKLHEAFYKRHIAVTQKKLKFYRPPLWTHGIPLKYP